MTLGSSMTLLAKACIQRSVVPEISALPGWKESLISAGRILAGDLSRLNAENSPLRFFGFSSVCRFSLSSAAVSAFSSELPNIEARLFSSPPLLPSFSAVSLSAAVSSFSCFLFFFGETSCGVRFLSFIMSSGIGIRMFLTISAT